VSGGEARRIAIARALLADAPILILDEPTEGLDAGTAAQLYQALDKVMAGRSVLLITHRLGGLSSLVDEVATMRDGRIAERHRVTDADGSGRHQSASHQVQIDSIK
ncbi:ATP-binding cassette domain-containing protein, partial [Rhodanobacter sp. 115]